MIKSQLFGILTATKATSVLVGQPLDLLMQSGQHQCALLLQERDLVLLVPTPHFIALGQGLAQLPFEHLVQVLDAADGQRGAVGLEMV